MDRESMGAGNSFLCKLDFFFGQEMSFEKLEKFVTSFISEVIFTRHFFNMDVFWFSLVHIMGIVGVFWSK